MQNFQLLKAGALALASALLLSSSSPVLAGEPRKPEPTSPQSAPAEETPVVNINTATVEELMRLPGIGAHKAEGIVARREKKKFARPEDLLEVKGIGRGIFKKCKPFVRVNGTTTLAQKVTSSVKKG